ncbi:M23 family metallopeptidase [Bacillus sp. DTU_2020_1000418_1_SI_GHA_SEK_038]|uniref:M23 family metallopeptidase n=1 Tax=Bacillus sp. DTU_2020_1000418_1_SI_GHA_SEK_038 TaxID=3077585 RepID=UPI0028E8CB28|nr:M23 family metallopeptidase [Bacillus sp. DTU_2020_1000418_1_SI_GHA_SEK_038]WNS75485.1 M23 family metallopeptidase [Bacillus sp. DTU_2020_1000418_1_SI_GHA_SEK_038]
MQDSTNKFTKIRKHTFNKFKTAFKKTALTVFAVGAISFAADVSAHANTEKLTTVYYVYVDKQYIGTVTDRTTIDGLIDTKLKEAQSSNENLKLSLNSEVTYVPEQVFHASFETNNTEIAEEVMKEIKVHADASALIIDGNPVAYVQNSEEANEIIKKLKLKYVSEEELNAVEAIKASDNSTLPPLKENETRILDVELSKEVSIKTEKIEPAKILSVEDAVKLLEKGSLEEVKYKVKEGDVLGGIAHAHNLKVKQLLDLNAGLTEDSLLQIGQELNVTILKPFIHVIINKEYFTNEVIPFEKEVVENANMFKGDTKVKQEGKDGKRAATYRISVQNGQVITKEIVKEEILEQPVKHIVVKGTKVIPSRGEGSFIWPTVGGYVSSHVGYRWGRMHKGIDIARPSNRTIKAADNGVVVSAGYQGSFGNKIVIDHKNGYRTIYAHLSSISVSPGQVVSKGSKIGVMGSTGNSTGVHLHFELYKNGALQNPLNYIR